MDDFGKEEDLYSVPQDQRMTHEDVRLTSILAKRFQVTQTALW
jgi:hypothetical protein